MRYHHADDRGQAAALVIGIVGVLAVIVVAIALFGRGLGDLAQAHTAADAAALAGAVEGRQSAEEMAAANGGQLTSFTLIGTDVVVSVTVGRASATARAAIGHAELPTLDTNGENRRTG